MLGTIEKEVYIAKRHAATFHDEVGELVGVEEVRRRQKQAQVTIVP